MRTRFGYKCAGFWWDSYSVSDRLAGTPFVYLLFSSRFFFFFSKVGVLIVSFPAFRPRLWACAFWRALPAGLQKLSIYSGNRSYSVLTPPWNNGALLTLISDMEERKDNKWIVYVLAGEEELIYSNGDWTSPSETMSACKVFGEGEAGLARKLTSRAALTTCPWHRRGNINILDSRHM